MRLFRILGLVLLVVGSSAWAQVYPDKSKPLKMIVPFGTGTAADVLARALARGMTEVSGVTVVVDNKPGAESVIGVTAAKGSPADGYTFLFTNSGSQVLNVHMVPQLPYDPVADFVPLVGIAKFTLVLSSGPSQSFKDVKDVIAAARSSPSKYTYGSATASTRLAMEMFEHLAGIKLLSVPYKAMSQATTALVSGEVDFLMNDAGTVIPHYKTGRLRPLATTGSSRMQALADVPTFQEAGVKDYEFTGWFATYFPANTPPAIAATMREILLKAVKTKPVVDMLVNASFESMDLSGDQLTSLQRADVARWAKVVRSSSGPLK